MFLRLPFPCAFQHPRPLLFQTREQIEGTKNLIEPSATIRSHETRSWPGLNYMCKAKYKTLENR